MRGAAACWVVSLAHRCRAPTLLQITQEGPVTLPELEISGENLSITAGGFAVALPALRSVGGSASIETSGDLAPALPALDRVARDLTIGGRGGLVVAPRLREVGGQLVIAPTATGELMLPGLTTIRGDLQVHGTLTALHLDQLASILGGIDLAPGNASSVPRTREIGNLIIAQVDALTTVDIDASFVNGAFYVSDAPALTALPMPSLRAVGADFIVQLTGIQELAFPQLEFSRSCLIVAPDARRDPRRIRAAVPISTATVRPDAVRALLAELIVWPGRLVGEPGVGDRTRGSK